MKLSPPVLLSLLAAGRASATPIGDFNGLQSILSGIVDHADDLSRLLQGTTKDILNFVDGSRDAATKDSKKILADVEKNLESWIDDGREFITQHGSTFELLTHPSFKDYQMRLTEPKLCDPDVQQYSGYLDISDEKHLFFWFFESRDDPKNDPLILWLNGGPGCSSTTGLLFELGPCSVADEGQSLKYNNYSWNSHANVIFLDQPINVGYSYSSDGSTVNSSPVAGEDVYAFLELFLTRYPKYSKAPFHIAAESYGGTYAPNFANVIYNKNKELELRPQDGIININLASVMLGNGLTDPYLQHATIPDFACDGPYPIYDNPTGSQCNALRGKVPTCQRLIKSCYEYGSRFTCVPAAMYCNSQLYGPIQQSGLNPYDVRRKCDPREDGPLCYRQMEWIETWMNEPSNKLALGVDPSLDFKSCNMQVNQAFLLNGDGMHNSALLLTDLVNDGVRLLVYAGNADYMCNFIGNEAWVSTFDNTFHSEFSSAKAKPWFTTESGKLSGTVRTAGSGAGNVTYVTVFEAGHMVPYDQPEASLDLLQRWINNIPITSNKTEIL